MPGKKQIPPQQQNPPGRESEMSPPPEAQKAEYHGSEKLSGNVAIITGGDSGIGRAVAILFAKEGASIISTTSVTAYRGSPHLLHYSAPKGAIVAFTRSLS